MAIADAGEDRDDLGLAFKPMQLDRRFAGGDAIEAGAPNECFRAGLGKPILLKPAPPLSFVRIAA